MRRVPADAWVALVLLVACGFFLNDLLATEGTGAYVKTTTLPTALVVVLALLALILLGGSLLRPAARPADALAGAELRTGLIRVGTMIAWTTAFIFALPWFGYLASSAVFLVGANVLYGNRRPVSVIAIAVIVPVALLLFFEKFMIVLLPSSRLFG
ncbi:MAG: tripartite tricarboxylate transporter TctB family protein [Alphaproteobacteria bacterium]|nr:tripartite tricarboxylate transporter TctB family protein [Alphaproteobacteria bacterium]MCZ6591158.1 tripartite tricarboxylate transporter TctB family protein [Alphaproteobacteria bacterium]MCZ6840027.1 tripartite tricarboxylate transporter TctB family protein [Alphaproteobacteria bacterium]